MIIRKLNIIMEKGNPRFPKKIKTWLLQIILHQKRMDAILHAAGIPNQPVSVAKQFFEPPCIHAAYMTF